MSPAAHAAPATGPQRPGWRRRLGLGPGRKQARLERWVDRGVLLGFAAAAGLGVVLLDRIGGAALDAFRWIAALAWWLPLLWLPAITLLILWLTRRYAPGAAGSGIPQVLAALDARLPEDQRPRLVSLALAGAKLLLTCLGLLAGLSLGREGPSVQIAAGIMQAARHLPGSRTRIDPAELLVAGGAAGIAAAFNAPLAGVMFAIEELSRTPEQRRSGLLIGAIVFAGLVAISIEGGASYFGVIRAHEIGLPLLLPALAVAVLSGLAGGVFSRLMVMAASSTAGSPVLAWRARHPYGFAGLCALAIALIGIASQGRTFGSGYALTQGLLDGRVPDSGLVTLLKFLATWLTTLAQVPGGIFAPSLAIGASLGQDVGTWAGSPSSSALIALGMVGFLAATTQAPMTAFMVVMEMVDGHSMIFSLMACALVARALSSLLSPPLYPGLARAMIRNVRSVQSA